MLFLSLLTFWFFLSFMRDSFCLHIVSWLLARDRNTTERNDDTWLLKLSFPGKQANSETCTGSLARPSGVTATFLRMRASTLMRPLIPKCLLCGKIKGKSTWKEMKVRYESS